MRMDASGNIDVKMNPKMYQAKDDENREDGLF
jgi:hypothetical protein